MQEVSPQSPEARARRLAATRHRIGHELHKVGPGTRAFEVVKRVFVGVFADGFIHAGNLAYLTIFTLCPFFIVAAALAQLFGRSADGARTVATFLHTLPPSVSDVLAGPIDTVLAARTGSLLWLGAIVSLWTVGSFIETIRDILRRAYGTEFSRPFWEYRAGSVLITISSVFLALVAFSLQVFITAAEQFVYRLLPFAEGLVGWIGLSRLIPAAVMFGALYMLFFSLTPSKYRYSKCRKWPGALFVTVFWIANTALLPWILGLLGGYNLTYGGLAGVIITLFFFWLIGLAIVIGAHLNAALAETPVPSVKDAPATA